MRGSIRGLVAGGIAGIVAVALMVRGDFTGGLPVVALSLWERATRIMPMEVFGFFIVRLKFAAKPLGFWGMLATLVVLWAVLGFVLASQPRLRHRPVASALFAFVLSFLPLALLATGPATGYLGARLEAEGLNPSTWPLTQQIILAIAGYASVFALIFGALTLWNRPPSFDTAEHSREGGISRRKFLRRSLALLVGTLTGSALVESVMAAGRKTVAVAQTLFERAKGLPPEITPNLDFYIVSKNPPGFDPVVDGQKWRLEIRGLVDKPIRLSYDEIRAMPSVSRPHTLECISNEVGGDLISNAVWRGVRLRDLLAKAGGVGAKATEIAFRCADGYTESIPIMDALNPDTLLVYEMNGVRLPAKHGFPVRLLVPGRFGMKNPKWITKIEAVDYDFQGYWERSGWSKPAIVKTMSKFTSPSGSHMMPQVNNQVELGGVAYAGDRGIKSVEFSTDDGKTWQPAQVKPPLGKYTWLLWAALWKPTAPGEYTLRVRARDGADQLQTAQETPTLPDGASGYHRIRLRVRR